VVADAEANVGAHAGGDWKAQVADREVALLQRLPGQARDGLLGPGQMDLAIPRDDLAVVVDQHGAVEPPALRRLLRIAEVESDPQIACGVEQRPGHWPRHLAL